MRPWLYLGTAHVALALACLFAGLWPQAVAGFFYHAWLVGLVHLVTIGWITFSILGVIYMAGPLALRMDLPVRRLDYVAYATSLTGLVGMVGHFWIQEYAGMAWSAGATAAGVVYVTIRIAAAVRHAPIQPAVKLHIVLACMNLWIAASMGLLMAIDKVVQFLPGFVLSNVFAHAHAAAVGWAAMMVVGMGYRLLPMAFSSKVPTGRSMYASAILLELGVLGLCTTLLLRSPWSWLFGFLIVAGLIVFGGHVVWMSRHPVAAPAGAPRIASGLWHAAGAGGCLLATISIGLGLLFVPTSPRTLHAAAAYGVFGLIGFLAQMIVAMEAPLLRSRHGTVFAAWTIGVPALAMGMAWESALLVSIGAWALFAGVAAQATLAGGIVVAAVRPPLRPEVPTLS